MGFAAVLTARDRSLKVNDMVDTSQPLYKASAADDAWIQDIWIVSQASLRKERQSEEL